MKQIWIYIYVAIIITFLNTVSNAQEYSDSEIKTVFIYQFGMNINWDQESKIEEFKIAVYGNDNNILPYLKKLARSQTIKGKPIKILWFTNLPELFKSEPHIIYIDKKRNYELSTIIKSVKNKNTLVISNDSQKQKFVMINFIHSADETINFEINRRTISEQNFKILPKLLLLGGSEIDIRELYKEQESELQEEKEKVETLRIELDRQKKLINELNVEIDKKLIELKDQKNEISQQLKEIIKQKKTLNLVRNDVREQRVLLLLKVRELSIKQTKINSKVMLIEEQNKKVEEGTKTLEVLTNEIINKQNEIDNKSIELGVQANKIDNQQNLLVYAGIILFLIILLLILLIISIRLKQKINRELKFKNTEILNKNKEIHGQAVELTKHRNQLELLVEERTSDLVIAKEKAEESDRLKSAFLANMSHEIRTPMNAIIGFSNLLNNNEYDQKKRKELVSYIIRGSDTLLHLINDIIDISKIEAGQLIINNKENSINEILDNLVYLYEEKNKSRSNNVEIKFFKNKDIKINTDDIRLQQVLINLIDNALKFTEKGFVEIGYNLEVLSNKKEVIFYVKDSGIGLTKEQQIKIFDRFAKLENEREKLYRGAGLGLSISKNIIELLGGKIWVESELNEGATFYFNIPFVQN